MAGVVNIQIRNVPTDVHETYKRRAAAAGMSLQEYLLAELSAQGRSITPAELAAEVEAEIARTGGVGFAKESSVDDIRRDRESH